MNHSDERPDAASSLFEALADLLRTAEAAAEKEGTWRRTASFTADATDKPGIIDAQVRVSTVGQFLDASDD